MKITYIGHSGFLIELEDVCFLFDYYKGDIPEISEGKALVIFVSHKHADHYNPEIFRLVEKYPKVQFVISKDVRLKWKLLEYKEKNIDLESHIFAASKNMEQSIMLSNGKELKLETLKSTDEGVAYFLTYCEKTIYHAGDLNLWIWEGESKQYNNNMRKAYFTELEKLKDKKIDIAFVPLDPRLEKHAFEGLASFMEYTESNCVFPMHFWDEFSIIPAFLKKYPEYSKQIKIIEKAGQVFEISGI